MQFLSKLSDPACWDAFFAYKVGGGHMPKAEQAELEAFIAERGYLPVCEAIVRGTAFALPRKSVISKQSSNKKRIVYTYPTAENYVLKLLGHLLQRRYDGLFARNLYSFRPAHGAREAVQMLTRTRGIGEKWAYKVDISNYFNSIPIDRLLPRLKSALSDAPETCAFLAALLTQPLVLDGAKTVSEQKGIMAGTPISPFLANLYLADLDRAFADEKILYARYSDDIILFADSETERDALIARLHTELAAEGLAIN
ncbi:MAG: hypothetical protein IKU55_04760, partial [Clostridia bacterium]|nr:hypothetical protein [Clostridia bacterium]